MRNRMPEMLNFRSIDPLIELAFTEDIGIGDITTESTVPSSQRGSGTILTETEGVIAGLPIAQRVFEKIDSDLDFRTLVTDGDRVESMTSIATVEGNAKSILTGERIALNFLQRLSGTATLTAQFVAATAKYSMLKSSIPERPPPAGEFYKSTQFVSAADIITASGFTMAY